MDVGIHLPQFGRAAVPGGIQRFARHAEDLGFAGLWVSDHLVVPASQSYPAPYLCDPLESLAFAAAATSSIGIGTSVLVLPQYPSPLALANTLATLDYLSGGRLVLGAGIGWSQAEYEALHAPFDHRGARLDEIIDLLRTAWRDDPASHEGRWYSFRDIRLLPKPAHDIPIWLGGSSDAAIARAAAKGDGLHGLDISPEDAPAWVARLRARRPDEGFTLSLRLTWDTTRIEPAEISRRCAVYRDAGVQYVVAVMERGDLDAWLAGAETIAVAAGVTPR